MSVSIIEKGGNKRKEDEDLGEEPGMERQMSDGTATRAMDGDAKGGGCLVALAPCLVPEAYIR